MQNSNKQVASDYGIFFRLRKVCGLMPVGFQKPKTKSGSGGPGGKNPGTACHGKNPVSVAAIPKDPPQGSSDWAAVKKSGVSGGSGQVGSSSLAWAGGPGSTGMFDADPGDFLALVPPGGSPALTDYMDSESDQMEVKEGHETPANNFWDKYKGCDTLWFEFFKGGQSLDGKEGEVGGQPADPQYAGIQIPHYCPQGQ